MRKQEKVLWYITVASVSVFIATIVASSPNTPYTNLYKSKNLCFIMYTETCPRCNYDKVESEYSIISNYGSSNCRKCNSHIEFTLDKNGNKLICNEEN